MSPLERDIEIATEAHRGQRDQVGGAPTAAELALCSPLFSCRIQRSHNLNHWGKSLYVNQILMECVQEKRKYAKIKEM